MYRSNTSTDADEEDISGNSSSTIRSDQVHYPNYPVLFFFSIPQTLPYILFVACLFVSHLIIFLFSCNHPSPPLHLVIFFSLSLPFIYTFSFFHSILLTKTLLLSLALSHISQLFCYVLPLTIFHSLTYIYNIFP